MTVPAPGPADALSDTNILLYLPQPEHPFRPIAEAALDRLTDAGSALYVVPQNVVEFWGRATRPAEQNGLGFSLEEAYHAVEGYLDIFTLLPDGPAIHDEWQELVRTVGVRGVQVHDARLVACMRVHGLTRILTFNRRDFARYLGLEVIDPRMLADL